MHSEWRKFVKKMQRKRRRKKAAQERDRVGTGNDSLNPSTIGEEEQITEFQRLQYLVEKSQRAEEENAWVCRELLAQRKFQLEQQRRAAEESAREAIRQKQFAELEFQKAEQQRKSKEQQQRAAAAAEEFERIMQRMEDFLQNTDVRTPPQELLQWTESRPGEKMCEFYQRTNCCRFGAACTCNHRKPLLSTIIVIRHFYTNPVQESCSHKEYAVGDSLLEMSEHDQRMDYDAFFDDVIPELKRFGKLVNFRTVCNVVPHLFGHVFVEYSDERSALKAFIGLQGRYYAMKRLNVEFSNLVTWRGAICVFSSKIQGLSIRRRCPRGLNCNYLHLFRNPKNKYNTLLEYTRPDTSIENPRVGSRFRTPSATPLISLTAGEPTCQKEEVRNWRWSLSPELELHYNSENEKSGPRNNDTKQYANKRRSESEENKNLKLRKTQRREHDRLR